jgi:hypothetical protein
MKRLLRIRFVLAVAVPVMAIAVLVTVVGLGSSTGIAGAASHKASVAQITTRIVVSSPTTIAPKKQGVASAFCPSGTVITGGGFGSSVGTPPSLVLLASVPHTGSWQVVAYNNSSVNISITAYAVCAS